MRSNSKFAKGSGVFNCNTCDHRTRSTGGDGADVGLCDLCYELAGEANHISDNNGKTYESPENLCSMLAVLDRRSGAGTAQRCHEEVCAAVAYSPTK